ncbi:MAG: hypothetical protein AMXMBFR84_00530 [Candidatus Hydrogenedentota bacterium]
MKIILFGAEAHELQDPVSRHGQFEVVETDPDVVVCFGGDGTLLSAEHRWPGIPKVPIRNSRRGVRCISFPPEDVLERLAANQLHRSEFLKLQCLVRNGVRSGEIHTAMNEFNVHMGHINSAVRFQLWLNGEAFAGGTEIIGDGLVISTPFGSTAYYNQITRGIFFSGLGIAFKNTLDLTNHVVTYETTEVRVLITRGPAILGYDNAPEYRPLTQGDELIVCKHPQPAVILTWEALTHPSDNF